MSININSGTAKKDLPQGIRALFFIQIFSTLSYSVLYSTLVLYMTDKLKLSPMAANSITGVFISTNFALHLLGGYLGGRFLSNRALFCFGMCAQIVGCVLLAVPREIYLYYGLAVFLTGSGLNVICVNCMLTQRFRPQDTRREAAFLWNYTGMNIGFFVGFNVSGYFQLSQSYQQLFLFSSMGNLTALLICLCFWHTLADKNTNFSLIATGKIKIVVGGLILLLSLPLALSQLFHYANWANKLVLLVGSLMLILIAWLAFQQKTLGERNKILSFAAFVVVSTIFWTLYQTGPMGLTQFIAHNVDRRWWFKTIPPQWFQNINTIVIVIGGPALSFLFTKMRAQGVTINIPMQFACALLFIGVAFIVLPVGIANAGATGLISPGWIVFSFILLSVGELLISPIGYAMIGAIAPVSLQGIMMGMWMLATGVGATLSSYSSNWMLKGQTSLSPLSTNNGYSHVFLMLGLLAIITSLIVFRLVPKFKVWMYNSYPDSERPVPLEPLLVEEDN